MSTLVDGELHNLIQHIEKINLYFYEDDALADRYLILSQKYY